MALLQGAALLTLFTATACSLSLDFDECSVDNDCASQGLGLVCSSEHYCVERASLQLALTSKECGSVYGPVSEPGTILIGSLLPTSGDNAAIGAPMEQAVILAVKEFNEHGGLGDGRRLGVVLCDTAGNTDRGVEAARHLVELGVPAVVGPAFSGVTLEVATRFAAPGSESQNGTVFISPSATNPAISDLSDQDRVWRTVPSDALQGKAMAQLITTSESYGLPQFSRVTVVYKDDAYGTGLLTSLVGSLPASGGPTITPVKYADPTKEKVFATELFQKVDETNPELVVLIGTAETAEILPFFEFAWQKRPQPVHWLLADGGMTDALFTFLGDETKALDVPSVLGRIRGTAPASGSGPHFNGFKARLAGEYGYAEPPVYTAQSYDAAYLIGFAVAASKGPNPDSGDIVEGLKRQSGGAEPIAAEPSTIPKAIQILATDGEARINFEGASSPLDFDQHGEVPGAIDLWAPQMDNTFETCKLLDVNAAPVDPVEGGCVDGGTSSP